MSEAERARWLQKAANQAMNLEHVIHCVSILFLLGGCWATEEGESEASTDGALVRATVSARLPPGSASDCKPLGFPITLHLSDVFGPEHLVGETATADARAQCLFEQELAAPADAFATLAYNVVCHGGYDTRLCGAAETRRCSVKLLMQLALAGRESVSFSEPTFGFVFTVPPQDDQARSALNHRAQQEIASLLDESEVVMAELAEGTRDCPDEDFDAIDAGYAERSRWLGSSTGRVASRSSRR